MCGAFEKVILTVCCSRKSVIDNGPLMVAVEMVNYYGVFEKELDRAGTANETDHGYQRRYRGPLLPLSMLSKSLSHVISSPCM